MAFNSLTWLLFSFSSFQQCLPDSFFILCQRVLRFFSLETSSQDGTLGLEAGFLIKKKMCGWGNLALARRLRTIAYHHVVRNYHQAIMGFPLMTSEHEKEGDIRKGDEGTDK